MKKIHIVLIGDPPALLGGIGSGMKGISDNLGNKQFTDPGIVNSNLQAISKVIDPNKSNYGDKFNVNSQSDNYNESYKNALKYAFPDLTNDDYFPDKKSIVVGEASSKTLGQYPIFSGASLFPSDIWAKRRAAIADFMIKSQKKQPQGDFPKYDFVQGSSNWEGAINNHTLHGLADIQKHYADQGVSLSGATDFGHPAYWDITNEMNRNKSAGALTKALDEKVKTASDKNLSGGTMFDKATNSYINNWKQVSALPQEMKEALLNHRGDAKNHDIIDKMQEWNSNIEAIPNLQTAAESYLKGIKDKAQSEMQQGNIGGTQEFIINTLKSQYPLDVLSKDKKGNVILDDANKDKFLTSIAKVIARDKPEMFQDFEKDKNGNPLNPNAPFSMNDLKEYAQGQLGYEFTKSIHTATEPGAGEQNKTTAVPIYIQKKAQDIANGVQTDLGKGNMIVPGSKYVTFMQNGVATVVPRTNATGIAQGIVNVGAKEPSEMGNIDASSAYANALTRKDIFDNLKNVVKTDRGGVSETGDFEKDFNNNIYQISGKNGLPLAGGDLNIKGVHGAGGNSSDNFFFDLKKGKETDQKGVVIPTEMLESTFKEPGIISKAASGIGLPKTVSDFFANNKKSFSMSQDGKVASLDGAYYHKEEPDANGVTYYTVYDKGTKKPYQVDDKQIRIPSYWIENITKQPSSIIKNADSNFPKEKDHDYPDGSLSVTPNAATKTAGGKSVGANSGAFSLPDEDKKYVDFVKTHSSLFGNPGSDKDAYDIINKLRTSTNIKDKNNWAIIQKNIGTK